jgi:hypothetical protein
MVADRCPYCTTDLQARSAAKQQARAQRKVAKDSKQAICTECRQPIYAGDVVCPSGHRLKTGWEAEFQSAENAVPKPPPKQAVCARCSQPIFPGQSRCPAGHRLGRGWETKFLSKQGVPALTQDEKQRRAQQTRPGVLRPALPVRPPSEPDPADVRLRRLRELGELRASGTLTEAEFESEKRRLLGDKA